MKNTILMLLLTATLGLASASGATVDLPGKKKKEKNNQHQQYRKGKKADLSKDDYFTHKVKNRAKAKQQRHTNQEVKGNKRTYGTKDSRKNAQTHHIENNSHRDKMKGESTLKKHEKPTVLKKDPKLPR